MPQPYSFHTPDIATSYSASIHPDAEGASGGLLTALFLGRILSGIAVGFTCCVVNIYGQAPALPMVPNPQSGIALSFP